jgi:single-stranded DNA-binding protein
VANYLKKGASVCVTGQVEEEQWSDKATGELKKALVVKNASVESWQARSEQATPAPAPARQAAAPASYEPIDDEVPF